MSQDPNQNRVAALTGTEAKTPLERAKQVQELQRAMEAAPVQQAQPPVAEQAATSSKTSNGAGHVAVFDLSPVAQVNMLKGPSTAGADQAVFGAKQADTASLFGAKGTDIEITGVPWKIIPFEPNHVMELKKPAAEYNVTLPQNAVKTKAGNLFSMTVTPKAEGSEPTRKKAVLVDDAGNLKGAEWGSKAALEKGLTNIPSFAFSLFKSVFDGVTKFDPKLHRVLSVEKGSRSAYEVKLEQKNEVDGKWKVQTATLNNFGVRVPPSNDARRHDLNVQMYYLDRFQAA